jgi:hypothetical protein
MYSKKANWINPSRDIDIYFTCKWDIIFLTFCCGFSSNYFILRLEKRQI